MTQFNLLSLLNGDNFAFYNRELAHLIGLHEAILFCELVSKHQAFEKDQISIDGKDGYFFCTIEELYLKTAISRKPQMTALKKLVEKKWIEQKNYGLPCKRYFRINQEKIFELHSVQKKFTRCPDRDKLEVPFGTNQKSHLGQTRPYYKKKEIEEVREEVPPNPPKGGKSPPLRERAPHVSTSSEDHEKLVKDFGEEKVKRAYERLSEWKLDTPKSKWKKSDYLAIRRWVMDALDDQDSKRRKKGEATSDIREILGRIKETHINLFRSGEIEILNKSICFKKGTYYLELEFADKDFVLKLNKQLQKMGVNL